MGRYSLDGAMIPRHVRRICDQRCEPRVETESQEAVLALRGRSYNVQLLNLSSEGAMLAFPLVPRINEQVRVQLLGHGPRAAHVRWVRDGKIGINFLTPLE